MRAAFLQVAVSEAPPKTSNCALLRWRGAPDTALRLVRTNPPSMSEFAITRQSPYTPVLLGSERFHWI